MGNSQAPVVVSLSNHARAVLSSFDRLRTNGNG